MTEADADLSALASAYGIATEFWDWRGQHRVVSAETIRAALKALDVDAAEPDAVRAALKEKADGSWRRMLPPCVVLREGHGAHVDVHVTHGESVHVWIELQDEATPVNVHQVENWNPPRWIDGREVGEASFVLPDDLPLGYHRLHAESNGTQAISTLVVTPRHLATPHRTWGLATQLYSVRSRRSWGVGDLGDLTDLATWAAAEHSAGFVLVNPMHAAAPVAPMEPSPYLPVSRRFANPIYLRVELIPEFAYLDSSALADVQATRDRVQDAAAATDLIDRDLVWAAKEQALLAVFAVPRSPGRDLAFRAFQQREGRGLREFTIWCAIAEAFGADSSAWPDDLRLPDSPAVAKFEKEHERRVEFHAWLQWVLDEQLANTQAAAKRAGMTLGVMHDLAVGVDSNGSDTWSMPDVFAHGVSVGAPPDAYNQAGQNWSQPPWRPDRLAELAYRPFRDMVTSVLKHAGGIRVDHVMGLFRLWWIPEGAAPTAGTYLRYDHDALVGILTLEAHRAGAVVVGEDLGTVEPWVRDYLRERGVLGTSVLWFEYADDGRGPLPGEHWRAECLASVTTHDLPPTSTYLAGGHVRLRHDLGLLTRPLAEELEADHQDRAAWLDELVRAGELQTADAETEDVVAALHRYLGRAPSRLLCLALTDAVGDTRAQNQPGTVDEYPNWRVPLSRPDGTPMLLEDVMEDERTAALARIMHDATIG